MEMDSKEPKCSEKPCLNKRKGEIQAVAASTTTKLSASNAKPKGGGRKES